MHHKPAAIGYTLKDSEDILGQHMPHGQLHSY